MELNKKKCGILRVCKKSMPLGRKKISGVSFVFKYKYLEVPLGQSLTLNHLVLNLKRKTKSFSFRIRIILHSAVGTEKKLNLW